MLFLFWTLRQSTIKWLQKSLYVKTFLKIVFLLGNTPVKYLIETGVSSYINTTQHEFRIGAHSLVYIVAVYIHSNTEPVIALKFNYS